MTTINREFLKTLKTDIEKALVEVAEKHGISLTMGKGQFESNNAQLTLNVGTISEDGFVNTREAENFRHHAPLHGISPDALGAIISYGSKIYKIIGWLPRSKRLPILAERLDGGKVKLPLVALKAA